MADVTMPQLGETVTEGTITKWFKQVGDSIAEDEVLFEVSTDKVDSEVPSPVSGTIQEILVPEGETVDVGAVLARIGDGAGGGGGGEAAPAEEAPIEQAQGGEETRPESTEAPAAEAQPEPEPEPAAEQPAPEPEQPAPAPEQPAAADAQRDPEPAAAPAEPQQQAAPQPQGGTDGRLLSPVVRRLINEHGLDPNQLQGTGAGGRITRQDVEQAIQAKGGSAAAPAPAPAAPAPAAPAAAPAAAAAPKPAPAAAPAAKAGDRDEAIPFSNIRRRTAEHMVMSKATSAHAWVSIEVDYDNVDRVRLAEKDRFKAEEGVSLTYLPFISRAVIDALREFPLLNSSVGSNELVVHHDINLGYAVDLSFEGLMVVVSKQSDGKRLRALAREVADLAERARTKKLSPDDISGGTFTLTNVGSYGTLLTMPIVNQPQIAILSTDGVKRRPVVVDLPDGSEAIAIHPVGNLAMSWDHRAVDGAYASAFVAKVKDILETRDWAAELA